MNLILNFPFLFLIIVCRDIKKAQGIFDYLSGCLHIASEDWVNLTKFYSIKAILLAKKVFLVKEKAEPRREQCLASIAGITLC